MLGWGVGVARWFLAFSTCSWNALSEQALHQSCEAVGVDNAEQRCVETACLQGSSGWGIAKGQLEGTTQNRGAPWKDEGNNTAERNIYLSKEKGFLVCGFCPGYFCCL